MTLPRPVGDLPLWETVMTHARHTCQCTGQCGNRHTKTGGQCDRKNGAPAPVHGGRVLLLAAPADPAQLHLPPHQAAALPAHRLAAWCPACHDHTRRRTAPATTDHDDAPSLF